MLQVASLLQLWCTFATHQLTFVFICLAFVIFFLCSLSLTGFVVF